MDSGAAGCGAGQSHSRGASSSSKGDTRGTASAPGAECRLRLAASRLRGAARRSVGLHVALLLGVPPNWLILSELQPQVAGTIAARCGNLDQLDMALSRLSLRCDVVSPSNRSAVKWVGASLVEAATRSDMAVVNFIRRRVTLDQVLRGSTRWRRRKYPRTLAPGLPPQEMVVRAARHNHPAVVAYLCSDPDAPFELTRALRQALVAAAERGHHRVVAAMIGLPSECCIEADAGGSLALQLAAKRGHVDVVRTLVRNPRGTSWGNRHAALVSAATAGHAAVVAELTRRGMPSNFGPHRHSAIIAAATRGHSECVQILGDVLPTTDWETWRWCQWKLTMLGLPRPRTPDWLREAETVTSSPPSSAGGATTRPAPRAAPPALPRSKAQHSGTRARYRVVRKLRVGVVSGRDLLTGDAWDDDDDDDDL